MKLPDHETHMASVHELAHEAREAAQGAGPAPGVIAPIFMGNSHETIPERYVLHFSETTCRNCSHVETDSSFFSLSYIRSRLGGTRVRHLVPCASPLYNLPVDRIRTGTHFVPYCVACIDHVNLSHLPPPPEPAKLSDLPEPQLKGRGPKPTSERPVKPTKPAPTKASLDDLI